MDAISYRCVLEDVGEVLVLYVALLDAALELLDRFSLHRGCHVSEGLVRVGHLALEFGRYLFSDALVAVWVRTACPASNGFGRDLEAGLFLQERRGAFVAA